MRPLIAALLTSLILTGLVLCIVGLRQVPVEPGKPTLRRRLRRSLTHSRRHQQRRIRIIAGVVVGAGIWWATGWVIAVVLAPLAIVGAPLLLQSSSHHAALDRLDAMAEWTRNLADVITVGVGIEHAIQHSRASAPDPIAEEVGLLCVRLHSKLSTRAALMAFADDLDDKTGDLIAAALINGSAHPTDRLGHILHGLAEATAEEARSRRAIEAERAKPRANSRYITMITVAAITGLFFTPVFDPYRSPGGQLLLLGLLLLYVGCLIWIRKATTSAAEPRFLGARARSQVEGMAR